LEQLPSTVVTVVIRQPHGFVAQETFSIASQRLVVIGAVCVAVIHVTLVTVSWLHRLTTQQHKQSVVYFVQQPKAGLTHSDTYSKMTYNGSKMLIV